MSLIVLKFGGTSVGNIEKINNVAKISSKTVVEKLQPSQKNSRQIHNLLEDK